MKLLFDENNSIRNLTGKVFDLYSRTNRTGV